MHPARLITADEFLRMPFEGPSELVRGRLVLMQPPGTTHGRVSLRLGSHLFIFLEKAGGFEALSETGFILERNPDTVRGPDVAVVATARLPHLDSEGFFDGAPDLAVEVRSPDNTLRELMAKAEEYLAHGTRAVWIVEPRKRRVTVLTKNEPRIELSAGDILTGGDVLPGFELPLNDLFRA